MKGQRSIRKRHGPQENQRTFPTVFLNVFSLALAACSFFFYFFFLSTIPNNRCDSTKRYWRAFGVAQLSSNVKECAARAVKISFS